MIVAAVTQPQVANSSAAGIITAVAAVLTSISLIITAIALARSNRRVRNDVAKAVVEVASVHEDVGKVHVLVNQRQTDNLRYIAALVTTINELGGTVPIDQSLAVPPFVPPTPGGPRA